MQTATQHDIIGNSGSNDAQDGRTGCPEEILKIDPKANVPIATAVSLDDERTEQAIDSEAMESIHKPYDTKKQFTAVSDIS